MKERLLGILHLRKQAFPDGNSLCYNGEKDGHFQELQKTPEDEEIVLFEQPRIINGIYTLVDKLPK